MTKAKFVERELLQFFVRFWAKVDKTQACWLWVGGRDSSGYGTVGTKHGTLSSHRVSYVMHHGEIPLDKCVMHTCDTPACVNPGHLSLGSHHENVLDSTTKGRHKNPVFYGDEHPSRIKKARRLFAEGLSIQQIAKNMHARPETVTALIKLKENP